MKKTILLAWIFIASIVLILGAFNFSQRRSIDDEPDVGVTDTVRECPPIDIDGDKIVELDDFANFARVFNSECFIPETPPSDIPYMTLLNVRLLFDGETFVGATETESIRKAQIGNTDINLGEEEYNGVDFNLTLKDEISDSVKILAFTPGEGWLDFLGGDQCTNLLVEDNRLCASAARSNSIGEGTIIGTMSLGVDSTMLSSLTYDEILTNFEIEIDVTDGTEIVEYNEIWLVTEPVGPLDEIDIVGIHIEAPEEFENGYAGNVDLEFENAILVDFITTASNRIIGTTTCAEYNTEDFIISTSRLCFTIANEEPFVEGDNLGLISFRIMDALEDVVINYSDEAKISDGENEEKLTGEYLSFSKTGEDPNVCGYADMDENGEVNLNDFSRFARVYNKSCTGSTSENGDDSITSITPRGVQGVEIDYPSSVNVSEVINNDSSDDVRSISHMVNFTNNDNNLLSLTFMKMGDNIGGAAVLPQPKVFCQDEGLVTDLGNRATRYRNIDGDYTYYETDAVQVISRDDLENDREDLIERIEEAGSGEECLILENRMVFIELADFGYTFEDTSEKVTVSLLAKITVNTEDTLTDFLEIADEIVNQLIS